MIENRPKKTDIDNKNPILRKDYKDKKVYVFDFKETHNLVIETEANNITEAKEKVKASL